MALVKDILATMDYGPAPEANDIVVAWLKKHETGFGHFIDGKFVKPAEGGYFDVFDPARDRILGKVAEGSAKDVDRAVNAARRAYKGWSALPGDARARYLYAIARHIQKRERFLSVLEIDGQRQADPRDPRHRRAARRPPLLPPRRLGRTARRASSPATARSASAGRSSRGTSRS